MQRFNQETYFASFELNNVNDLLLQCHYFLIIFCFLCYCVKEINCFEAFSKMQNKWSKIFGGVFIKISLFQLFLIKGCFRWYEFTKNSLF